MKITIVTVGKVKEKFYRDAIAEYAKRLGRYCTLEILEVADEKTPDGAAPALEQQIIEKEGRGFSHVSGRMLMSLHWPFRESSVPLNSWLPI